MKIAIIVALTLSSWLLLSCLFLEGGGVAYIAIGLTGIAAAAMAGHLIKLE